MQKSFRYSPKQKFYTTDELEAHLNFRYLPQITFETEEEKEEVRSKGLAKLKSQEVTQEAQELGKQWIAQIEVGFIPDVSIRWLDEHLGYGLFAEETLEAGSYIGEYTGIVRKNDRRYFEPLNNYCYEYPVSDYIGRSYVIDATQGNSTRFINHSYTPNLRPIHVFYDGFYHLIFLALQRIDPGTQLCFNYGKTYWYIRKPPVQISS